jgi:adenylate cyclase
VLPFTNMSSDPEQEFFSDGITEDIITALSKISALLVIARNSTFIYKGQAVNIKQVGREQGVRFVLEGSVRKSGDRVRINAQLIDAITGQHKWAERYDRELVDVFDLQDDITKNIVTELNVQLLDGEQARFWSSGTENLEAWECFRLARNLMDAYRTEDLPEVKRLLQRAIDLDPEYASAWDMLSGVYFHIEEDARYSEEERKQAFQSARDCAERALECDPACASAYGMLGFYYLNLKEFDEATANANKAVKMAPNYDRVIAMSAVIINKCGEPGRALEMVLKAMRLCPVYPLWYLTALGQIYRLLGRTDESADAYIKVIMRDSDHLEGHIGLAEILAEAGRIDEAKDAAAKVLHINPEFSIAEYTSNLAYRDQAQITRFAEGLRQAGLPE